MLVKSFYEKEERKNEEDDEIRLFRGLFLSSHILKGTFVSIFVNCRQYHALCMLGLGFVASLAIIWVIHNYGKLKISVAIPK